MNYPTSEFMYPAWCAACKRRLEVPKSAFVPGDPILCGYCFWSQVAHAAGNGLTAAQQRRRNFYWATVLALLVKLSRRGLPLEIGCPACGAPILRRPITWDTETAGPFIRYRAKLELQCSANAAHDRYEKAILVDRELLFGRYAGGALHSARGMLKHISRADLEAAFSANRAQQTTK